MAERWNFSGPLKKQKPYKRGQRPAYRKTYGATRIELELSLAKVVKPKKKK